MIEITFRDPAAGTVVFDSNNGWGVDAPPGWVFVVVGDRVHYYPVDVILRIETPFRQAPPAEETAEENAAAE